MATIRKRTGRHGDTTYTAMVRRVGFPTLTKTFPTKREAESWASGQEGDIITGRASPGSLGRKRTLGDAVDRYRAEVQPLLKNGAMYGFTLDWWKAHHGQRLLGEVSRGWLTAARAQLLTGTFTRATPGSKRSEITPEAAAQFQRTPATCNRYMAALSSVFTQVCGDWEWLPAHANPFQGLSKLPEGHNKGKGYTDQALAQLLKETAMEPQLHTMCLVALATAARAGELVNLTWACVELGPEEGRLMFTDTKNGSARIAWVFGDALEALKAHKAPLVAPGADLASHLSRPVFPGQWSHKDGKFGRYDYLPRLYDALTRAGLKMARPFHAFRHTAATNMARMGANAHQLKGLGGWKSNAVDTYVHLAGQDTKDLAQAYAKRLKNDPMTIITKEIAK
jgi:integrase